MNRYEMTYIIDATLEDSTRKELIEKFTQIIVDNGGEVEKVDETWGKRRLAYVINYKSEGYYVLTTFKANSELPKEIERVLEISESVIRYLVVKLEEKRSNVKPRAVRVVTPMAAPVAAPIVVEAAAPVVEAAPAVEAAPEAPVAE